MRLLPQGGRIVLGAESELGVGSILDAQGGSITVGRRTAIGPYVVVYGMGGVTFGEGCSVAAHCTIVSSTHVHDDLHTPIRNQGSTSAPVIIEEGVWLGANSVVREGVRIGANTIVGAGAVVTADLPPRCVAVGVPAKVLRYR